MTYSFPELLGRLRGQLTNPSARALLFLGTIVLFLHFLKIPTAFLNPQFYAEDATIFYAQDYALGPLAFLKTYAGYLHTWPRLWTFLIGFLPLSLAPLLTKLGALIHHAGVLVLIANKRLIVSNQSKALMMLSTVLILSGGEVYANLANGIAYCSLILILVFSFEAPETPMQHLFDFVLVLLAGLTGPYVLFLGPLFFIYNLYARQVAKPIWSRYFALVISFVVQLLYFSPSERGSVATNLDIDDWSRAIEHFFRPLIFGSIPMPRGISQLVSIGIIWYLVKYFTSSTLGRGILKARPLGLFLTAGFLVHASALFINKNMPQELHPLGGANRYFFVPYVLLLWAIIINEVVTPSWIRFKSAIIGIIFAVGMIHFFGPKYYDLKWREQLSEFQQSNLQSYTFKIYPEGWAFSLDRIRCWRCK